MQCLPLVDIIALLKYVKQLIPVCKAPPEWENQLLENSKKNAFHKIIGTNTPVKILIQIVAGFFRTFLGFVHFLKTLQFL